VTVSFAVRNTGSRAGAEIAQVYASLPSVAGEPPKRLIGWERVDLSPGQSKTVTAKVPLLYLSIWNEQRDSWQVVAGEYQVLVGGASNLLPLSRKMKLAGN
jgi:beta-glucosidase